ncbi:MAG TPA: BTAD domain-containing putative transcriptional regulator [Actinoallomurus sp.]
MTVPEDASPVSFDILGPLRAWRAGSELELGPGKQRAVLAVLLLNANRPTPTSRIIDAVWGDEPPENGVNVVQKYVAGLRRILEPGRSPRTPGQQLTWTEAGYTLNVPPGCLDAAAFRDRVAWARSARSAGHPSDAAGHLQSALALWRDETLAGLRGPFFDAARDRLAEERAAAFEESAQIELDLGHHARLVPELGRLVAEFPVREEPRYLLILALYRCGRQAEALAAYQDARTFLTEEFGVEPGERLQQLHLAILRSDRVLAPGGEAPMAPTPVPAAAPVVAPPVPAVRRRSLVVRMAAVAVPLLSFGTFSWAAIAFIAARRRSPSLALASAGYFLLVVVFGFTTTDDPNSQWETVAVLSLLLAMAGGAAHTALLLSGTHARSRKAQPVDYDTLRSLELRIRREQALTLLDHHPHIARELHIGRPDLARVFNDGGLVDVNAVPEHILAALPGVSVPQAQQIVARRRAVGGFASLDDLVTDGLLPVTAVRALSDVLIVVCEQPPDIHAVPERIGGRPGAA